MVPLCNLSHPQLSKHCRPFNASVSWLHAPHLPSSPAPSKPSTCAHVDRDWTAAFGTWAKSKQGMSWWSLACSTCGGTEWGRSYNNIETRKHDHTETQRDTSARPSVCYHRLAHVYQCPSRTWSHWTTWIAAGMNTSKWPSPHLWQDQTMLTAQVKDESTLRLSRETPPGCHPDQESSLQGFSTEIAPKN